MVEVKRSKNMYKSLVPHYLYFTINRQLLIFQGPGTVRLYNSKYQVQLDIIIHRWLFHPFLWKFWILNWAMNQLKYCSKVKSKD